MQQKTWFLTWNQVNELLEQAKIGCYRDYLFIKTLWVTGCRVNECLAIVPRDINFETRRVVINNLKHDGTRTVFLDESTANELGEYCNGFSEGQRLFPFNRQTGRMIVNKWGQICGYKQLTPHALRRSLMTHLHQQGLDIYSVKQLLGHQTQFRDQEMYLRLDQVSNLGLLQFRYDLIFAASNEQLA